MIRIRTAAASVAAAIAALAGMTACSSSGTGSGSDPTSVTPTTTSATGSVTPPAAASTSNTPTADTSAVGDTSDGGSGSRDSTQCAESQLRASVASDDIKGLSRHVVKVSFTNTSTSSCTLTGFPGAAIVDDSGKQVQQAKRTVGGPVGGTIENSARSVALRAGATAYAYLEGTSIREQGAAQAGCDGATYPRILITPPNTDIPVPFTIGWPQCYSFSIHPVRSDS